MIKDGPDAPRLGCNLGYFYGVSGSKTPARTAVIDLPSCPMQRSRTKARQRYTPTQNNQNNRRSSSLTLWKHPLHLPIRTRFRPDSASVSAPWRVTGSDHARTCLPHACLVFELAGPHEQRRRQDVKIAIQLHNSEWKYQAPSVRGVWYGATLASKTITRSVGAWRIRYLEPPWHRMACRNSFWPRF